MPFVPVLGERERQQALGLLAEGFPHRQIDWSSAFAAPPGRRGHGWLLTVDGTPHGCLLAFEKTETIRGRRRHVVNLSNWYIRPPYRALALPMLRAATADADTIYTGCTPRPSHQPLYLRVGFRYLWNGSIVSVPVINGLPLPGGVAIEPFAPAALSDPEQRRWMVDHSDDRHIGLLIRRDARRVPVLWRRGLKVRGFPAARLLFTTDHTMLRAALPAIHWHMLRRDGIVGLYLPRIAPYADLRSVRKPDRGPSTIVKGDIDDADVNLLYSELLYLSP